MENTIKDLWLQVQSEEIMNADSEDSLLLDETFSPRRSLLTIAEAVKNLSSTKQSFLMLKTYGDFIENSQYQPALQSLEAEVRKHIKLEHQLKLFIEHQEETLEKIKEETSLKQNSKEITLLQAENLELQEIFQNLEKDVDKHKTLGDRSEIIALKKAAVENKGRLEGLEACQARMNESWIGIEKEIDEYRQKCSAVKKENARLKASFCSQPKTKERTKRKALDRAKKLLTESTDKSVVNRSLSPCLVQKKALIGTKSIGYLHSKRTLIRDMSIEKLHTDRQLTSKRKF